MANIKVTSKCALYDGMSITFKAPCDSSDIEGLKVVDGVTTQSFSFRDTHGNILGATSNLFSEGTYVKAVLDTRLGYAYLQNSASNGYLEQKLDAVETHIANTDNPHGVTAAQVGAVPENDNIVQYVDSSLQTLGGTSITMGGAVPVRELILGSTTWTVPEGVTSINVLVEGAGGGGSIGYTLNSTTYYGRGGSAGETASGTFEVTPGTTYNITIGRGGTPGCHNSTGSSITSSSITSPGNGGSTSFGSLLSASGGAAGGKAFQSSNSMAGEDGMAIPGVNHRGGMAPSKGCGGFNGGVGAGGSAGYTPANTLPGGAGGDGACVITYELRG